MKMISRVKVLFISLFLACSFSTLYGQNLDLSVYDSLSFNSYWDTIRQVYDIDSLIMVSYIDAGYLSMTTSVFFKKRNVYYLKTFDSGGRDTKVLTAKSRCIADSSFIGSFNLLKPCNYIDTRSKKGNFWDISFYVYQKKSTKLISRTRVIKTTRRVKRCLSKEERKKQNKIAQELIGLL